LQRAESHQRSDSLRNLEVWFRGEVLAAQIEGAFVSNRKKTWKGPARGARSRTQSEDDLFELALRGDGESLSKPFDSRADRKTLQLCRQVQRALMLALAGECGDDLLRDVLVDAVVPAGGAGHLLVQVNVPRDASATEVVARLNNRVGQLRAAVAASISRKRTPMLSFIAVPANERDPAKSDIRGNEPLMPAEGGSCD
jgi:ribosome-binding factor A